MDNDVFRRLLCDAMQALNRATLVGNPAPVVVEIRSTLDNPALGAWVVEVTTGIYRKDPKAVGRLILVRREPIDGPWDDPAEPRPLDTFWYIETPEGECVRWCNCTFITVPGVFDPEWAREAVRRHGL